MFNFHYVEKVFENLVLNKKILRFINGIQKSNTRVYDVVLAESTKKDAKWWGENTRNDLYLTAEEALELGVIDQVI